MPTSLDDHGGGQTSSTLCARCATLIHSPPQPLHPLCTDSLFAHRPQIKLFLYLNDVNASNSPYQYVRGSHVSLGPLRFPPDGEFHPTADVERAYPPSDLRSIMGPAGLVFAASHGLLHRGAPLAPSTGGGRRRARRATMQWEVAASLAGGTDGGVTAPLMRIPARLRGLYEAFPRVFARVRAGYLTVLDSRPPPD